MGEDLFGRSQEAYQKSVALLPNDADWHYGYGDLLCETANWNFASEIWLPSNPDLLTTCMIQLQLAIQLNPSHIKTLHLLQWMSNFEGIVDLSGPKPDFLILTPGNYHTPTPWRIDTLMPSPTSKPSATITPSPMPSATLPPPANATTYPNTYRAAHDSVRFAQVFAYLRSGFTPAPVKPLDGF